MKKMVGIEAGSYIFDASAKTVTFSGLGTLALEQILLITNVTDNILIYNFADAAKGGSMSSNVLTLDYDTASMSDDDRLQIFVSDTDDPTWFGLKDVAVYLKNILNAVVRPVFMDPTNGTVRVTGSLTTAGTVSTVSTVTSVTTMANQTNIGGFSAQLTELYDMTKSTWAASVRSRIS